MTVGTPTLWAITLAAVLGLIAVDFLLTRRPHEVSLQLFQLVRQSTAEILDRLTPADWVREGTHTEAGPYGVESWLKIYADHAHKHARQIRVARDAAKGPITNH